MIETDSNDATEINTEADSDDITECPVCMVYSVFVSYELIRI